MEVKYEYDKGSLYLYFCGELDEHYAKGVREYVDIVAEKYLSASKVIFNMSKLTFMDSTGIGVLLGRYKKMKKQGISCYIQNPQVNVDKVLELSGIYEVMPKV